VPRQQLDLVLPIRSIPVIWDRIRAAANDPLPPFVEARRPTAMQRSPPVAAGA